MIFVVVLIALLALTNYYMAKRLHKGILSKIPFLAIFVSLSALTIIVVLGIAGVKIPLLQTVGSYWMGIFLYLLIYFAVAEICGLICKKFKVNPKKYWAIATVAVICLTIATVGYGAYNAKQINNVSYEISLNKKDVSDLNIVMISDLHLGAVGSEERLFEIVSRINALKPDVVCIAGDFFDTDFGSIKDPEAAIAELKKISSTHGVFMCMGNHDGGKTAEKMMDFVKEAGITALNEEYVVIDNRLVLVGRLDGRPIGGYKDLKRGKLSDFLTDYDKELPVIVMDHNPKNIDEYDENVDLVLSGHTHKGQLFPIGIITDLMYDVDYGYYRKDSSSPHVIVTSGIGYWGLPVRVGTESEIVSIKIF